MLYALPQISCHLEGQEYSHTPAAFVGQIRFIINLWKNAHFRQRISKEIWGERFQRAKCPTASSRVARYNYIEELVHKTRVC